MYFNFVLRVFFFLLYITFFRLPPGFPAQMTFMKLDLSSLESVRAFVAEFKASKLGLDSLVLNAGVMHNVRVLLQTSERCGGIDKRTNDEGAGITSRGVTFYQRVHYILYPILVHTWYEFYRIILCI